MNNPSYVYILSSKRNGTLYIGVTSNLQKRISEHKSGEVLGFSSKYGIKLLVWFEEHPDIISAIQKEKQLKKWKRDWKLRIIEELNPQWKDLSLEL